MAASSFERPGGMITGINVTPLVDVVLVLLIILMVTASYVVSKAIPLDLPKAATGQSKPAMLAVSLDHDGTLFVEGKRSSLDELGPIARRHARLHPEPRAAVAADGAVEHRTVVSVLDTLRRAGVTQFAINVSPEELANRGK